MINIVAGIFMLAGSLVALLAGVGVLRFETSYARFHAAGKASPVAFIVASIGAALELGLAGTAYLLVACGAMILTLPIGVHLLFRAHYRANSPERPAIDELSDATTSRRR